MLRFNFAERKESTYSKFVKPDLIFFVFLMLGIFIGNHFYTTALEQEIKSAQLRIDRLNREIKRLHRVQRTEKELISLKKELQRKLKIVSALDIKRRVPSFLYFFADSNHVKNIWLTYLIYSDNRLELEGGTLNVARFPKFLEISEENLGKILFRKVSRHVYVNRELDYKITYYKFNFGLELRHGTTH